MHYFVLEKVFNNDKHPALGLNSHESQLANFCEMPKDTVLDIIQLSKPNPNLSPGHYHPCPYPIISETFAEIICAFTVPGIQLLKCKIDLGKRTVTNHLFIHIYNVLDVVDRKSSQYKTLSSGRMIGMTKLVLDQSVLNATDPSMLQLFKVKDAEPIIVNQELADAISSSGFEEVRPIPIDQWNSRLNLTPKRLKKLGFD